MAMRSYRIRLGLSPRLPMLSFVQPLLRSGFASLSLALTLIMLKTSLLSLSHKDFCLGEFAFGPYVSGSSIYAVGYSVE